MADQFRKFLLKEEHIFRVRQSGFRSLYSSITALLNITNDILRALEKITLSVLLDFSKAFEAVNHEILIAIL